MIWHIFKKDLKLEWRLALGVAFTQLLVSGMLWKLGSSGQAGGLGRLVMVLGVVAFMARGFLIVETVHHDAIPGVRQDWLVRPIRRSELLAAKCLFTVLVVQLPVFAGDLMEALADGFSFGPSLNVALSRSLYMLVAFSLPVLALASVTRNLLEVLTSGVIGVVLMVVAQVVSEQPPYAAQHLLGTGLGWTVETSCLLTMIGLTAAILAMQFRRRMTTTSRWLAVAGAVVLYGTLVLPWQPAAFALQTHLSPAPGAARSVQLLFEPNPGPVPLNQRTVGWAGRTNLRIALAVSGLPADSILTDDHYELHLIDSQGVIRAKSRSFENMSDPLLVGKSGAGPVVSLNLRSPAVYNLIPMDTADYLKLKDQKLRLEIDYSLTLMGLAESYAIPAAHGDERLPDVGWCTTRVSELGDSIRLGCLQPGPPPDCYSWFLEHTPSGRRNVEEYGCFRRDYSPYFAQFFPNALSHFGNGMQIRFHDPTGQAHYAVDAPDISEAKVVIRNYRPLEHFTRTVTTPEKALSDWLAK